jgi:hypothetical protein
MPRTTNANRVAAPEGCWNRLFRRPGIHDHDIHLRVIDLNEIERSFDLQLPRRRIHRFLSNFVVSQASPYKGVNVVNPSPDGACIGRLLSATPATRRNLAHELTERRPFGNEVDLTNRRLNDSFNARPRCSVSLLAVPPFAAGAPTPADLHGSAGLTDRDSRC